MLAYIPQFELLQQVISQRIYDIAQLSSLINIEGSDSLRQMGLQILQLKRAEKYRIEQENSCIDLIQRIPIINHSDRSYLRRFSNEVIKMHRPNIDLSKENSTIGCYIAYFQMESQLEYVQLAYQLQYEEFKASSFTILFKCLLIQMRNEFHQLLRERSLSIVQKMKLKQTEHQLTDQVSERPKRFLARQSPQRGQVTIIRSSSVFEKSITMSPTRDKEKEHWKTLRSQFNRCYGIINDFDETQMLCSHIVVKKKYIKQPDQYSIIQYKLVSNDKGNIFILSQMKFNNSLTRQSIMNHLFRTQRILLRDRLSNETILSIHSTYNKLGLSRSQSQYSQSPTRPNTLLTNKKPQFKCSSDFYDPTKIKTVTSTLSLSVTSKGTNYLKLSV